MRRVLTGDLNHETNTFSRRPTGTPEFESYLVVEGPEILARFRDVNHEQAGFIDCAARYGWELVPTVVASANPGGTVTAEAFERYAGLILDTARTAGPWDGVALSLHGAMVADAIEDGEGELLRRLRDVIGPDVPVAVTLDLHANVTPDMAALANILVSYKTYPHVDMRETAVHAGRLLEEVMAGRTVARTIVRQPPQLEGLDGGRTDVGPMVGLLDEVRRFEAEEGIHAVSLNAGFALADIACVGPSVTVTFDRAAEACAHEIADRLAAAIWASRDTVTNRYLTPAEAADLACGFDGRGRPLVIADYADNPGAGAYGDATNLLAALLEAGVTNACFGAVCDPEVACGGQGGDRDPCRRRQERAGDGRRPAHAHRHRRRCLRRPFRLRRSHVCGAGEALRPDRRAACRRHRHPRRQPQHADPRSHGVCRLRRRPGRQACRRTEIHAAFPRRLRAAGGRGRRLR
jgi:microcystin degradation protein MlrC